MAKLLNKLNFMDVIPVYEWQLFDSPSHVEITRPQGLIDEACRSQKPETAIMADIIIKIIIGSENDANELIKFLTDSGYQVATIKNSIDTISNSALAEKLDEYFNNWAIQCLFDNTYYNKLCKDYFNSDEEYDDVDTDSFFTTDIKDAAIFSSYNAAREFALDTFYSIWAEDEAPSDTIEIIKIKDINESLTTASNTLSEEIKNKQLDEINTFLNDVYDLRKKELSTNGEYSIGNLVFKTLRNKGYLDNLKDLKNKLIGKELSLESLSKDNKLNEELSTDQLFDFETFRNFCYTVGDSDNHWDELILFTSKNIDEWFDIEIDNCDYSPEMVDAMRKEEADMKASNCKYFYINNNYYDADPEKIKWYTYYFKDNYDAGVFVKKHMSLCYNTFEQQILHAIMINDGEIFDAVAWLDMNEDNDTAIDSMLNLRPYGGNNKCIKYSKLVNTVLTCICVAIVLNKNTIANKIIDTCNYNNILSTNFIKNMIAAISDNSVVVEKLDKICDKSSVKEALNNFNFNEIYDSKIDEAAYRRLSDMDREKYRTELSRITFNQAIIQDSGLFNIYNVKENDIDRVINRIRSLDYVEWVNKNAGKYDFSKVVMFGQQQPRYYNITGKIKDN